MMKKFTLVVLLCSIVGFGFASGDGDGDKESRKEKFESKLSEMSAQFVEQELRMSVFPNPTSGPISIVLDVEEGTEVKVEVFDLIGKQVMDFGRVSFMPNQALGGNLSGNPKGIYFVKVTFADNSTVSRKVILER